MGIDHSTLPFSAVISRDDFGRWLSGFTDGEGCFNLRLIRHDPYISPAARFAIILRYDDRAILKKIRLFLGVGRFGKRRPSGTSKAGAAYTVTRIEDLHLVIVPLFERYPLLAKKAKDFEIWKQAVSLAYTVSIRKRVGRGRGPGGVGRGYFPKWTPEERAQFVKLLAKLKATRRLSKR